MIFSYQSHDSPAFQYLSERVSIVDVRVINDVVSIHTDNALIRSVSDLTLAHVIEGLVSAAEAVIEVRNEVVNKPQNVN